MTTFCPATMCPLFAADGSPWTGEKNGTCPQKSPEHEGGCGFWGLEGGERCGGACGAEQQVREAEEHGGTLQIGPVRPKRGPAAPRAYECPRVGDCQWQAQAGADLCPPRLALSKGLDPRLAAY